MSYDNQNYGFTSEGFSANPNAYDFDCSCGECEECEWRKSTKKNNELNELKKSLRYKEGANLVAGLITNKQVKYALIRKIYLKGIDSAIANYMTKEALPLYYLEILKNEKCIEKLVQGMLFKVCHINPSENLNEIIANLGNDLRRNFKFSTPYNRVAEIQKFIHCTVDEHLGKGASCLIPVSPMKNALSASRLHLSIYDILNHHPLYSEYIDDLAKTEAKLEYNDPSSVQLRQGKNHYPRWRVRHLRPLSYFYSQERRFAIEKLMSIDENITLEKFIDEALVIFAA